LIAEKNKKTFLCGYDPHDSAGDCVFDAESAETACDFFAEQLVFIEGEKAGRPFVLEPWQRAIIETLFGWKRPDGMRRYREAFIFVPRKNGKTPMTAGLLLFMCFADGEPGAQIYSAAAEREQAALVFRHAAGMIARNPEMERRSKVYRTYKSIEFYGGDTVYKALSAEAETKHGYNAHAIVIDELHAQPNRDLVDVLITSTGSRRQPLIVHITTAGFDRNSICYEKYDYACKVRDGSIDDPSFLPVIYEAGEDEAWDDPETWERANPNLDVSVSRDYLRRECQRAKDSPAYENTFRRLHLNQWTQSDSKYLSTEQWNICGKEAINEDDFKGKWCYAGLDLSTTTDITAFSMAFPLEDGGVAIINRAWAPAENARKRELKDRVPYGLWAKQGYLTLTDGNVIDYDVIRAEINALSKKFHIKAIAADRWNGTQFIIQLGGDGFEVAAFGQGFKDMTAPTKELGKLVVSGKLRHGNNPLLTWTASNLMVEQDAAGNVKPSKKKSTERIDPMVAAIMAIGMLIAKPIEQKSVYEERGMLVL
jgi:phage terminase large subunit-like protein